VQSDKEVVAKTERGKTKLNLLTAMAPKTAKARYPRQIQR
jgi:hypothetical protein